MRDFDRRLRRGNFDVAALRRNPVRRSHTAEKYAFEPREGRQRIARRANAWKTREPKSDKADPQRGDRTDASLSPRWGFVNIFIPNPGVSLRFTPGYPLSPLTGLSSECSPRLEIANRRHCDVAQHQNAQARKCVDRGLAARRSHMSPLRSEQGDGPAPERLSTSFLFRQFVGPDLAQTPLVREIRYLNSRTRTPSDVARQIAPAPSCFQIENRQ